jgi:hypothetical protein
MVVHAPYKLQLQYKLRFGEIGFQVTSVYDHPTRRCWRDMRSSGTFQGPSRLRFFVWGCDAEDVKHKKGGETQL